MPKVRIAIAACLGMLAFSALASASASAAGWMVNGSMLSGSQALATTAKVDENIKLKAAGVTIECTGSTLNSASPQIESENKGSATALEFTECKSTGGTCSLEGSKIQTEPISLEATLEGTEAIRAKIKPKTGTKFTSIGFEGEECALLGCNPVTGAFAVLAPTGQKEHELQAIKETTTEASGELKLGSSGAEIKGTALLKLANSEPWSFL